MVSVCAELFPPTSQAEPTAPKPGLPSPQEFLVSRPQPPSVSTKHAVSGNITHGLRPEGTTATPSGRVLIPIDIAADPAG
jgi:hypothetical protein